MTFLFKRNVIFWAILLFLAPAGLCPANGESGTRETLAGFDYLMDLTGTKGGEVDLEKITGILDFVARDKTAVEPVCEGGLEDSPMAYHGIDVATSLTQVLRYCFNPDIASCAVVPSLIRLSFWRPLDGDTSRLPDLWERLEGLDDPIVVPGAYYMQNTPDPSTGAYYGYDSYRTLILMKYKGRNVLVSVLKQKDVSEVGKKGYLLEDGEHADFFYSGKPGLNKLGLGWVKSYLYDSFSVAVYMEHPDGEPGIRYGVFKWLRAGWAGKNMIREKHVREGLCRFAKAFKDIMESRTLPPSDALAHVCHAIRNISSDELKKKMQSHLVALQDKYSSRGHCPKMLRKGFDPETYIGSMSPMEMRAALIVDAIRQIPAQDGKSGSVAYRPLPEDASVF